MKINKLLKEKDDIYHPNTINKILNLYDISLKKRFGQNFLINKNIANYIANLLALKSGDRVIEIGPGLGAITLLIAEKSEQVIAFEVDRGIYRILNDILKIFNIDNVILINEDFFKISAMSKRLIQDFNKLVSNFPYSSGQKMVIKVIEEFRNVKYIAGTLQKEVIDRFIALPGDKNYSFISVWAQYISEIRMRKIVSPANFFPKPEVDSSITEIVPKTPDDVDLRKIKDFIKCCFSNKRKSIVNNMLSCKAGWRNLRKVDKRLLVDKVEALFGDKNIRAERLSYKDFILLFRMLEQD